MVQLVLRAQWYGLLLMCQLVTSYFYVCTLTIDASLGNINSIVAVLFDLILETMSHHVGVLFLNNTA